MVIGLKHGPETIRNTWVTPGANYRVMASTCQSPRQRLYLNLDCFRVNDLELSPSAVLVRWPVATTGSFPASCRLLVAQLVLKEERDEALGPFPALIR